MLEPPCDLLRRPLQLEFLCHDARQGAVLGQFAALGAMGPVPGCLIGLGGPIAPLTTIALDLAADRRGARPRIVAIAGIEKPATTAREISSRSAKVSANLER